MNSVTTAFGTCYYDCTLDHFLRDSSRVFIIIIFNVSKSFKLIASFGTLKAHNTTNQNHIPNLQIHKTNTS
jgi:hypothetical protein